jgi:hypothetical protein
VPGLKSNAPFMNQGGSVGFYLLKTVSSVHQTLPNPFSGSSVVKSPFMNGPRRRTESNKKPIMLMIGAHPDDCELKPSGTAALWATLGTASHFVTMTGGTTVILR